MTRLWHCVDVDGYVWDVGAKNMALMSGRPGG